MSDDSTISFFVDKAGSDVPADVSAADVAEAAAAEPETTAAAAAAAAAAKRARGNKSGGLSWKKRARMQGQRDRATASVLPGEEGEEQEKALEDELFGDDLQRSAPSVLRRRDVLSEEEEEEEEEEEGSEEEDHEDGEEEKSEKVKEEPRDSDNDEDDEDEDDDDEKRSESTTAATAAGGRSRVKAAWVDEDDEEQTVALSQRHGAELLTPSELARLRGRRAKVVSGTEYQRRLRRHAEQLRASFMSAEAASKAQHWASLERRSTGNGIEGTDDGEDGSRGGGGVEAVLDEGADEDVAALLQSTERTTSAADAAYAPQRPTFIHVARLRDANAATQSAACGAVCALQFHPRRPHLLLAGTARDSYVRLYDVDGEHNSVVAEAALRGLRLEAACLVGPDATEAVATGTQPFLYVYDLPSGTVSKIDRVVGRSERAYPRIAAAPSGEYLVLHGGAGGEGVVLSGRTKQLVGTVRLNSPLMTAAVFSHADPNVLYAAGAGGDVFAFDMRMLMRCTQRFSYSGASNVTALAVAPVPAAPGPKPADRYMAVGSDSGVVDIFPGDEIRSASLRRSPVAARSLMNLTTAADGAVFNHDAQLLAISSRRKANAFKLVHLPSCTVFSNWPTPTVPTNYVYSTAFSPNGGYLAVGNDRGRALLFRMCHWKSA